MRNKRAKLSKKSECDGQENSIEITVPPMGIAVFSCTPEKIPVKAKAAKAKSAKAAGKPASGSGKGAGTAGTKKEGNGPR